MDGMTWNRARNKGTTRLTPQQYVELVVKIMDNAHAQDVVERAGHILGARSKRIGPIDLCRNVLLSWVTRTCRAYSRPPLVSALSAELALALGDTPASVTVDRYAKVGGRPMPTTVRHASNEAYRYAEAAGYSGVILGWSLRSGRLTLSLVKPDDLRPEYASDDPSEPTIIRHRGEAQIDGKAEQVVGVYDLSDLDKPSYRLLKDGRDDSDVTMKVHGRTYTGEGYIWRYESGQPFHRIVMRGHPDYLYQRLQQVEASLVVPVRWTAWGSGTDFASHPGRNVRGMKFVGVETGSEGAGFADGPDVIKRWIDEDQERPGDHWQDAPAFDPLTNARAVALYESLTLSSIDLPMDLHATGGEPSAREAEALEERIVATFDECRRFDGELLRRCAALANRLPQVVGEGMSEEPYGVLYRSEVDQALAAVEASEPEQDHDEDDEDTDDDPSTNEATNG